MSNKGVDIGARVSGSTDALKDIGLEDAVTSHEKTRAGVKTEKPPDLNAKSHGKYTTSGTLEPGKLAFSKEAPNYGPATTPATSCKTCIYYEEIDATIGTCKKYDFPAENHMTCDNWESKKRKSPNTFIRRRLR